MMTEITVCVCTYNEERNIKKCIQHIKQNDIDNILIIDAGTDKTKEIAEKEGAIVLTCEKGLARQRQMAIDYCETKYLAFVDADDEIEENCIRILLKELKKENYDAIQASVRVFQPKTYWQKAIDATWKYCIYKTGPTNMIGRPAIYKTEAIRSVGSDINFVNIGDEDTAISIRMEQAGYRQAIGHGISFRKCHKTFAENRKEWIKYGKGDAMVIKQYPQKRKNIYEHLLVNYPIKRSWDLFKKGKVIYCLYPIFIGLTRFFVMHHVLYKKAESM